MFNADSDEFNPNGHSRNMEVCSTAVINRVYELYGTVPQFARCAYSLFRRAKSKKC